MTENKPKEIRHQEILDAASICFSEKGYLGTSVNDICKKAGITKGGLYWHFSSKKKILIALVDQLCDINQQMWQELEHLQINENTLREVGLAFIKHNIENESKVRLFAMLEVESLRDQEIKNLLSTSRADIHAALTRFGKKVLSFYKKEEIDASAFAHFLNISVSGIVQRKITGLIDIDVNHTWNAMCDLLLQGIKR